MLHYDIRQNVSTLSTIVWFLDTSLKYKGCKFNRIRGNRKFCDIKYKKSYT